MTTSIRNASWVIAWDASASCHVYLRDADVVFSGNSIIHVGHGFAGAVDEVIDGRDLMVMPGLIDIHSHPSTEPFFRGVRGEHGLPSMYRSGFYDGSFVLDL